MGQKVNPNGIRLGITKPFSSTWYAGTKDYANYLAADFKVREYLQKTLKDASVSRINIERPSKSIKVTINTARPGLVCGQKGEKAFLFRFSSTKSVSQKPTVSL